MQKRGTVTLFVIEVLGYLWHKQVAHAVRREHQQLVPVPFEVS